MSSHTEYLTGTTNDFAPKEEPMITLSIPATQAEIATLTERLINDNPSVQKVFEATSQVYNVAKNYNGLTRYSLEKIETPVQAAYVASQAPLKRMDQYAGNVVDRAGEIYTKVDLNRRVVEPVAKASDNILTSAERAVDSYLPETRAGQRASPSSETNANQRERAVILGRTLVERIQERVYRIYLLVASVTLFLLAQSILLTVEFTRDVALFTLTTGLKLAKAPRVTSLELLDRAQSGVLYATYLVLHPVELVAIVYDRYRRIQQRIAENNNNHKKSE